MEKYQTTETLLRDEQGTTRTVQNNSTINQPSYATSTSASPYTTAYTTPSTVYTAPSTTYTTTTPSGTYSTTTQSSSKSSNMKSKWNNFVQKMQVQYNRRFGSAAGDIYRSDPLGGYTRKGPGYYEKKHKFTRRITRRGNPPPVGPTTTYPATTGTTYSSGTTTYPATTYGTSTYSGATYQTTPGYTGMNPSGNTMANYSPTPAATTVA